MPKSLFLLLALCPAPLAPVPRPVPVQAAIPASDYFQANAGALVHTGDYHRGIAVPATCGRPAGRDLAAPCFGRDGLVVWRRGVRVRFATHRIRT